MGQVPVAEVSPPLIRQDLRRTATARILRCPDAVEDAVQASPSHHVQRVPVLANIHTTIDAPATTRHANTIIYSYPVPAMTTDPHHLWCSNSNSNTSNKYAMPFI